VGGFILRAILGPALRLIFALLYNL
jgi:hypothetical protein